MQMNMRTQSENQNPGLARGLPLQAEVLLRNKAIDHRRQARFGTAGLKTQRAAGIPMADFWSETLHCVVGHRLAGPASALNASPREQTLLDEAANNLPRRDVDLLNERRRIRPGVHAHIAQRGHFPPVFPVKPTTLSPFYCC
jgi:hypothetical protein